MDGELILESGWQNKRQFTRFVSNVLYKHFLIYDVVQVKNN